jgi:hypothetical protein
MSQLANGLGLSRTRFSGGGFVGALDDYTANLSVMLLPFRGLSSYEGDGFRVRDTNDDAEQAVGFDASTGDLASFSVVGDAAIRWWYDQSDSANHVPQATAAAQPYLTTGIVNGQPVARLDGTDDFLRGDCPNENGRTIYMVVRMRSSVTNARLCNDSLSGNASTFDNGSSAYGYYSTTPNVVDPVGGTSTNWNVVTLKYSSGTTLAPYVNNTAATPFGTTQFKVAGGAFWLGSDVGGASSFAPLDIAARIQYDVSHDDTTRQAIQTILAEKFNITMA